MLQVRRHVEKVLRLNGGDVDDYDAAIAGSTAARVPGADPSTVDL